MRGKGYPLLLLLLATAIAIATPEEEEAWLEADDSVDHVSGGELTFITKPTAGPLHHLHNRFAITEQSLEDGWVTLEQCHDHLDVLERVEINYAYRQMRNLKIIESSNIGKSWVEGSTVQLASVHRGARLCITAEVKILTKIDDGYRLESGPYHRRFLDGYYPMHVTVEITYPLNRLQLDNHTPPQQTGLVVKRKTDGVTFDAWFEGMLTFDIIFRRNLH